MINQELRATFPAKAQCSTGFTLVEIMIVVAIIGLLSTIALPAFSKSRSNTRKTLCINNLRLIDSAKEQYIFTEDVCTITDIATFESNVNEYIKNGKPYCPAGGTYSYGGIDKTPTCSITEHILLIHK